MSTPVSPQLHALVEHRGAGGKFLELGSANGVITIMADLLGFEAYGIELDPALVRTAVGLASDDFDLVFGFPWGGEAATMLDPMKSYGNRNATLLLYTVDEGVRSHRFR